MVARVGAVKWAHHRSQRITVRPFISICKIENLQSDSKFSYVGVLKVDR